MKRIFVIVRADLSNGAKTVQSIHAVHELIRKNGELLDDIYNTICYKVVNEKHLLDTSDKIARELSVNEYAWFREPIYNNETTAFAAFTDKKELFNGMTLA